MADTVESQGTEWPRPGPRTTRVIAALVVLSLVVAAPVGFHWWTHPDLLEGSAVTAYVGPQPVDEAATAFRFMSPRAAADPVRLTWHEASAVLATNTAQAEVTYALCDIPHQQDADTTGSSWQETDLTQVCIRRQELRDGTHLTYPNPEQIVLMTITPTQPGRVHLTGVDIRYSLGADRLYRHGTDHVAFDVHLTVR